MDSPISLWQNRLNVETKCGIIAFVGDGALDVPITASSSMDMIRCI